MEKNKLTDEQKGVLFDKATEPPFSGALLHEKSDGTYRCANCNTALFDSNTKFDSGSGWPSFDSAIDGTIVLTNDSSHGMERVEISCANCSGHLGHLFNDGPTKTNQRYCVNSLSLDFEPSKTS